MHDIFISYSRNDAKRIEKIVRALERKGWRVWWDRDIPIGEDYEKYLHDEIRMSRCVIVAWSKTSTISRWVKEEALFARDKGIILPVLLDRVEIPFGHLDIQNLDLSRWKGSETSPEFIRLLQGIERFTKDDPTIFQPITDALLTEIEVERRKIELPKKSPLKEVLGYIEKFPLSRAKVVLISAIRMAVISFTLIYVLENRYSLFNRSQMIMFWNEEFYDFATIEAYLKKTQ